MSDALALWLTTDAGRVHYACGPRAGVVDLAERYEVAGIASAWTGPCCHDVGEPCAFERDDSSDSMCCTVLAHALARVEGRTTKSFIEWCETLVIGPVKSVHSPDDHADL